MCSYELPVSNMRELADCILHLYLQGFLNSSCVGFICYRVLLVVYQRHISRFCSLWACCISKLHLLSIWPWGRVSVPLLCIVMVSKVKVYRLIVDISYVKRFAQYLHFDPMPFRGFHELLWYMWTVFLRIFYRRHGNDSCILSNFRRL